MRTTFRALSTLGFVSTALLILLAYAKAEPPELLPTLMCGFACAVAAVWAWRDTNP